MSYLPPHRRTGPSGAGGVSRPVLGFKKAAASKQQPSGVDPAEMAKQKESFERLNRRIVGAVNRVSSSTIPECVVDLLRGNIERGRGLFAKAVMSTQEANTELSPVLASFVSVVNKEFPDVVRLLLKRLVIQWRRYYRRQHYSGVSATSKFLASLFLFGVIDEGLLLQMLSTLLCQDSISEFDIDVTSCLFRESFKGLEERNPQAFYAILEPMRDLLHADPKILTHRSESVVSALFEAVKIWQQEKQTQPVIPKELALVPEEDWCPHDIDFMDEELGANGTFGNLEGTLDRFQYDANFDAEEREYEQKKIALLGELAKEPIEEPANMDDDGIGDWIDDSEEENNNADDNVATNGVHEEGGADVEDDGPTKEELAAARAIVAYETRKDDADRKLWTEMEGMFAPTAELFPMREEVTIRKNIVMALQSSLRASEAAHKLMKGLVEGSEPIVTSMIIEACCEQRSYDPRFGLIAGEICSSRVTFQRLYALLLRYRYATMDSTAMSEKNIDVYARIYAHLFASDCVSWETFEIFNIPASDVSQRTFLASFLRHLMNTMGVGPLLERFRHRNMKMKLRGLFPMYGEGHYGEDSQSMLEKCRICLRFFSGAGPIRGLAVDLEKWWEERRKRPREE